VTIFVLILLACAASSVVYASFFEWTLHRFVMHRPILGFSYPYRSHGITHHTIFGSAKNYHLLEEQNRHLVTMAWWNGPVLMLINAPAGLAAGYLAHTWWGVVAFMVALVGYYVIYEYFHWCMHVPGPRWFQTTRLFKWVDQHHRLHHLQPMRNLNVVIPIADFILRTRLSRAPMA
jgi:hypothetical protein